MYSVIHSINLFIHTDMNLRVYNQREKNSKLRRLAVLEGYDNVTDLLEENALEYIVPGICMNEECEETYNYEPDQNGGYCEVCETNTVVSCVVLSDLI